MRKRLTDPVCYSAKAPRSGRLEIYDTDVPGLSLRITAASKRSFSLEYRVKGDATRYRLTLGQYPMLSLQDARTRARDALALARAGTDPIKEQARLAAEEQSRKLLAVRHSVAAVVRDFVERYAKPRLRSWRDLERTLQRNLVDGNGNGATRIVGLGGRDIRDVRRADIHVLLDTLVDRGTGTSANRTLAFLRRFFSWAIERGYVEESPCSGIKKPAKEFSRDRVLTDVELAAIWSWAAGQRYPLGPVVQLLILTGQRSGEITGLQWDWIGEGVIAYPAAAVKNDRAHALPLSRTAQTIIDALPRFSGPYLFSTRNGEKPIWLGHKAKVDAEASATVNNWRWHDIRRTVASGLARLAVEPHVIERILNHSSGKLGGVAGIYNRYSYRAEMLAALERWAAHVEAIAQGHHVNVVALRSG